MSNGGLSSWTYAPTFKPVTLTVDTVDRDFYPRYVRETNTILEYVLQQRPGFAGKRSGEERLSRVEAFDAFLPLSLLEKLRVYINQVLISRMRLPCSTAELKGIIILHVLAASYGGCVSSITAPENKSILLSNGNNG